MNSEKTPRKHFAPTLEELNAEKLKKIKDKIVKSKKHQTKMVFVSSPEELEELDVIMEVFGLNDTEFDYKKYDFSDEKPSLVVYNVKDMPARDDVLMWRDEDEVEEEIYTNTSVKLYDLNEAKKWYESFSASGDKESKDRRQSIYNIMKDRGPNRDIGLVMPNYKEKIEELRLNYPNFREVIDYYEGTFALAMLDGGLIITRPIILNGEAGIGKTSFANAISKVFNTEFLVIPMSTTDTGTSLSGSSPHWSNTQTGKIFDQLVFGNYGNPTILLDEVDKAITNSHGVNPLGALYTLLETDTASKFSDQSIDVPLNASYIVWVLTSNSLNSIPDPILDRLTVFNVPSPTESETVAIAKNIYNTLRSKNGWGKVFPEELTDEVISKFVKLAPRALKNEMLNAVGVAARDGRKYLLPGDVKVENVSKRSIGF